MSFLDDYRKRCSIGGKSLSEREKSNTEYEMNLDFKDDPSYRFAKLTKLDLKKENIDIRVVNVDKSPDTKRIYVMPNSVIDEGNYISFNYKNKDYTYIIDTVEDNLISPFGNATLCKNILKWRDVDGNIQEYPCVVSYQSYGVKIFQATNDILEGVSTNIAIEIPRNEITEKIPLNLRVIFGNNENGIYKVGDISVYNKGTLKLTCKKDYYIKELDDLKNNLAFNDSTVIKISGTKLEYFINGKEDVVLNEENTYDINYNGSDGVVFEISNNMAIITKKDTNSCTVKTIDSSDSYEIIAKINNKIVASKVIYSRRW